MADQTEIIINEEVEQFEVIVAENNEVYEIIIEENDGGGGADLDLTAEAGSAMSSGRVVTVLNGIATYFDPTNDDMYGLAVGLTKTSANIGDQIGIKSFGKFYESGLNLTAGQLYFAGVNGTLVLSPENLTIVQPIGVAMDADNILINIQNSIETI